MKPITAVHLDLKGCQFRPSYLPQYLEDLASLKIDTLFIEYEDVFPYKGMDIAYDRKMRWSPATLRKLHGHARQAGITIVPIVQCLGHLEYLLAWKKYNHLALDKTYPSTIDIENPEARNLVQAMLAQVMAAHPDSPYVHLGMDEAHALVEHHGREKLVGIFLDYLETLLAQVAAAGKTAIIWADMLENNLQRVGPKLASFKDRVILASWDYAATGQPTHTARLAGQHIRRRWRENPQWAHGPAIGPGTTFLEDQPAAVRKLLKPHESEEGFSPLYLADMWAKMGFRVLGCSAIRASADYSVLPLYNLREANIRAWSSRVKASGLWGHLATSWARGNSFIPPNYMIDAAWPLVEVLSESMGHKVRPFFEGVDRRTQQRLFRSLGRCRVDWSIERQIADEMESLLPKVRTHQYEWQGIILLARTLGLQRQARGVISEMDYFAPNHRPVWQQWQRRLDEQKKVLAAIAAMKRRLKRHFGQRWRGQAIDEWLGQVFEADESRIMALGETASRKMAAARKLYDRP